MTWNDIYEFFLCPQHGLIPLGWMLGMTTISILFYRLKKGAEALYARIQHHRTGQV